MGQDKFTFAVLKFTVETITIETARQVFRQVKSHCLENGVVLDLQSATSQKTYHWFIANAYFKDQDIMPRPRDVRNIMAEALNDFSFDEVDGALIVSGKKQ